MNNVGHVDVTSRCMWKVSYSDVECVSITRESNDFETVIGYLDGGSYR